MQTRKSSRPAPKDRPPLRRASLDTSPPIDGVEESARLSEPTPVLLGRVSSQAEASFLSLRRGERWLGEAETEWGNHLATAANANRKWARTPKPPSSTRS
ncbi:hypothetical protein EN974_23070 [Mesorhizobium sp. M7A.F.Ca.CA.001.12.2.1]|nr:hypothetical protein EN974_23070 [Mesorhizobium sp. M7A.F.Ca.CA.001.12.2.1]RUZ18748.1 hypothetical protein EN949_26800 [Mesorhizobium sp. M7A.F.Ca.US.007.01.2.1]RUZ47777.1 hypothetical protein EN948_10945 [Mesorhizobium sp. M7A.F.Ca.US.003.02.1.1]RUZ66098.1 hypothetical protein EN950_11980 [Mesorhizobium sp. M7A.F.Ca.US.007.01.1.1]RUZ80797.1 hypothetical protein EN947_19910 [Mesorhizobium sp. M7A.F.Ca.US.003.02.2.1]